MAQVCYRCEKAPRVSEWHCQECHDFLTSPGKTADGSLRQMVIFSVGIVALIGLLGFCASQGSEPEPQPISSTSSGYEAAAEDLGIDAGEYERSARSSGLQASEALAAELVICRETGDCPAGMSQREARDYICRRTGDC